MIEFKTGDLFAAEGLDALAHGVNCAGAMGAGIAVEFRRRWPLMFSEYKKRCTAGRLKPGDVFVWDAEDRVVFNLATQAHWRTSASLDAIWRSVTEMLRIAENDRQLVRIGIPRIGSGLGGLDWDEVRTVLVEAAADSKVTLTIFSLESA